MTELVRIALNRPYTFVVLALLLLIIGPLSAMRTPVDIFPDIRIPVIGVIGSTPACRRIRCPAGSSPNTSEF
jgi:multidrug efflux pump subunit AcrB